MNVGITIFGVAKRDAEAAFCYAFLRPVRGPGHYPSPALPKDVRKDGTRRIPIEGYELDLITWDKFLDDSADATIQAELKEGRFTVPAGCPIEAGRILPGMSFGPLLIMEAHERIRVSGTGILHLSGLACEDGIERASQKLVEAVGRPMAPAALAHLIPLIAVQSGLGSFFTERRRIGVIDRFSRTQVLAGHDGPLFVGIPEKPDLRSREPMRRLWIRRAAATSDQSFRLHIILKNFDEVLADRLVDIPAGQAELLMEANGHITDVTYYVFDHEGRLADHVSGAFIQEFDFGITAQGRADALPPVFAGAPRSAELENRRRLHTSTFKGPAAGDRSGGLDLIRRQRRQLAMLIGQPGQPLANAWFERGGEGQIDVIRWMKTKIENPATKHAYLVDPYLGSDALRRVIARQGHENVALTVLVSPGGINPDADVANTKATDDYLAKLVTTAEEWAKNLCGRISIIHVQRGDGARQAFHDRYLSIVDQQGVPTVYLLSNSLSRAAGDWPFAISELDRITSWRVHGYIQSLIEGKQALIWKSAEPANAEVITAPEQAAHLPSDVQPEWVKSANALLMDLRTIVLQNADFEKQVGEKVRAFLQSWSSEIDTKQLAEKLYETVLQRDGVIVFLSGLFAAGTAKQHKVAHILDDFLLDQFLSGLPKDHRPASRYLVTKDRNALMRHLGSTIARKDSPTNFVRAKLNPIVFELVQIIESQRFDIDLAFEALEAGIVVVSVGLEAAIRSEQAQEQFRIGMAADYIHWLGRLTRSDIAEERFDEGRTLSEWLSDLKFAVTQVLAARKLLGEKLDQPVCRVLDDPLVLPLVKRLLGGAIS